MNPKYRFLFIIVTGGCSTQTGSSMDKCERKEISVWLKS